MGLQHTTTICRDQELQKLVKLAFPVHDHGVSALSQDLLTCKSAIHWPSAGIESGQTLQLEGEGGAAQAKNGTPGSLYVELNVAPDPVLKRQGPHIHVTLDVNFIDAILGTDSK